MMGEASIDFVDLSETATRKERLGDRPCSGKRANVGRLRNTVVYLMRHDRRAIIVRYASPRTIGLEYTMEARHFYTILYHKWLDDTIMNAYYALLTEKLLRENNHTLVLLQTHVHALLSTKFTNGEAFINLSGLFDERARFYMCAVLVNGNHWISVLLDVDDAVAYVYDSLRYRLSTYAETIMGGLRGIVCGHCDKAKRARSDANGLTLRLIEEGPKQNNGKDCGVYALAFAHAQVRGVRSRQVRMGEDIERYGRDNLAAALQATHVS